MTGITIDDEMRAGVDIRAFRVRIRRGESWAVRPRAEQVDGKVWLFKYGWVFEPHERYANEQAWIACDTRWPADAPHWIASGDLEPAFVEVGEWPPDPSA